MKINYVKQRDDYTLIELKSKFEKDHRNSFIKRRLLNPFPLEVKNYCSGRAVIFSII